MAVKDYLDKTGLALVWEKIKNITNSKVDKVDGKGLSTNDYTSNEKTKLANVASGAQVNVIEGIQKNGTSISPVNKIVNIPIPTATSDLTNDSGFITTSDIPEGAAASTTTPNMDGTAAIGTELAFARGDHRHPTDTSRASASDLTSVSGRVTTLENAGYQTASDVSTAIAAAQVGAAMFQGTVSSNTTISDANYKKGMYWVVSTAGTYVGQTCEAGDMIFAVADKNSTYSASDFSVIQNNLDLVAITSSEINTICV